MEKVEKFIQKEVSKKETLESEEKLPPNVKIVETEKAKFKIAYGKHDVEMNPEESGKADALMLEKFGFDYTLPKKLVEENFNKDIRKHKQYGKIIKKAEREGKPIFLGDITEDNAVITLQYTLRFSEPVLAYGILMDLAGIAGVAAGAYFLSELPIAMLFGADKAYSKLSGKPSRLLDEKSAARAVEKFLIDLSERIHPEINAIIVTLRNSLFAQKMKTIAERLGSEIKDRKPEIALTVGAGHHGIERALKKEDEKRVRLINILLKIPGQKKIREKIATIARFDYDKEKDKWELTDRFKDSHLAKIEK